ncbi:MAG: hypothetical protein MUP68_12145, partial [Deltaproteobacteria bacterium]|nr:hypothetical protein [Deltaproteobacteria bacterium]
MSLIMEAIKKAQQLRLQEWQGPPFFKNPGLPSEKRRRVGKYFWIFTIPGLGLILLFSLWGNYHLPGRTQPQELKVAFVAEKPSPIFPATRKESPEDSGEKISPVYLEKPRVAAKILGKGKRESPV